VAVIGIAGKRLGMKDELTALGSRLLVVVSETLTPNS
jgi:hypothetical protein